MSTTEQELEKIAEENSDLWGNNKRLMIPLNEALVIVKEQLDAVEITEDTSDGYHTFKELYEFRRLYNTALFNEWAKEKKYKVHKSKWHSDGELAFGGGWFIVVAELPTGQISNHYEDKYWDSFRCEARELPNTFDGHTAQDVADRLQQFLDQ